MANSRAKLASVEDRDSVFSTITNDSTYHKSLDFSNVGLDETGNRGLKLEDETNFRKFHQMTMYIQVPYVYKHGTYEKLANKDTLMISSNLPEQLNYKIGSNWNAPLEQFGSGFMNLFMQMAGPKLGIHSGVNRVTTLQVWNGSQPLELDLKIPVLDDGKSNSKTNLMEALEILGTLVLPSGSDKLGFYIPPPSPLNANIKLTSNYNIPLASTYGRIMLQLGGMLLVDNCIVTGVDVSYPNTKTLIRHSYKDLAYGNTGTEFLHPLLADVTIHIKTIEAITSNTYSKMLWAKPQTGMGSLSADLSAFGDKIAGAFSGS